MQGTTHGNRPHHLDDQRDSSDLCTVNKTEAWIRAMRLRTLPLSFSSVFLGSLLALYKGEFNLWILVAALLTTLFLQVLSNLANDYGDAVNGVDDHTRVGPQRSVQSGVITPKEMRVAIALFGALAFLSGLWLLKHAANHIDTAGLLFFLALGLLAIAAAVKYTIGKKPYGYRGFGDLAVFVFFGLAGVAGTFYLHAGTFTFDLVLPAVSIGLLAVGVLNINNLRDLNADKNAGKITLAVILGNRGTRIYHFALISGAVIAAVVYTVLNYHSSYQFLFLISLPLLFQNVRVVLTSRYSEDLDAQLKKLAVATMIFALTFGLGLVY